MYASDRDNRISISSMSRLTNKQSIIDIYPSRKVKHLLHGYYLKTLPGIGANLWYTFV